MRYQFTIQPARRGRGARVLGLAAILASVAAGYGVAACGDRNPDQARAEESIGTTPTPVPAHGPAPVEQPPPPTTVSDFYNVGRAAWKSGDFTRAESAFVEAIALDSTHVPSRMYLVRVLLETGRAGEALSQVEPVFTFDSASSEPFRLQGRAFQALGRTDEAASAFRTAIVKNEKDVWAIANLGALYLRLGRFEEALGPLARAIELERKVAIFHNNLGRALEGTGHYAAAVDAYRGALAVEGTYGPAVTNLARVELLKDDPATVPVDLGQVSRAFQEQVGAWKSGQP